MEKTLGAEGGKYLVEAALDARSMASRGTLCYLAAQVARGIDHEGSKSLSAEVTEINQIIDKVRAGGYTMLPCDDPDRVKLQSFCVRYGQPDVRSRICPSCLNETPVNLSLCTRCNGLLLCAGMWMERQGAHASGNEGSRLNQLRRKKSQPWMWRQASKREERISKLKMPRRPTEDKENRHLMNQLEKMI